MGSIISPPLLKKGDTIGIFAPARKVTEEEIKPFTSLVQDAGYRVVTGRNLFGNAAQFSGSVEARLADMHQVFTDPEVKAVFAARGGYGAAQLLAGMDWEVIRYNPKWLIGFSDVTALHAAFGKFMETVHGPMPYSLVMEDPQDGPSFSHLFNFLTGNNLHYTIEDHPLNVEGVAEGAITGGNLSVLHSLAGTPFEPDFDGKILFLEDVDEYLYHIDRMILNFELRNIFRRIAGLLVGSFSAMHDNAQPFGKGALEIIAERAYKYNVPAMFGFPAGHKKFNFPLIFGRVGTLTVRKGDNSLGM
jgi:muramoyltetrapeptide carboxypeptidase